MHKITNWIQHHQIVAFFLLTLCITSGLGFSFDAVINHGKDFLVSLISVAICGSAFAEIIIKALKEVIQLTKPTGM